MTINRKFSWLLGAAAVLVTSACGDLEVVNTNAPDIERALASPEDVRSLANSAMRGWYHVSTDVDPYMMTGVTADVLTSAFGNFGMRFNNVEPRIPYGNNSSGGDQWTARWPWEEGYAVIGQANDVIRAIDGGLVINNATETAQTLAVARFVQAGVLSNLAWLFDRAFIVDEGELSLDLPLSAYPEVGAAALASWETLIAATTGATWGDLGSDVIPLGEGLELDGPTMNKWANTMAARHIAYMPRTGAENAAADWGKVLTYASNGITDQTGAGFDISVIGLGPSPTWVTYINYYGNEPSWLRIDHRVINMMAPNVPDKVTGATTGDVVVPVSLDDRLPSGIPAAGDTLGDFYFHNSMLGDPLRGIYMQSAFSHLRRYSYARTAGNKPGTGIASPYIMAQENNLLIAEALVRTNGDFGVAADLINLSRVDRGGLTPAAAGDDAATLLGYIDYERQVEIINTGGFEWFDGRRFERLQNGTARHLPIPAAALETHEFEIYTFGGVGLPDMRMLPNGMTIDFRGLDRPNTRDHLLTVRPIQ